MADEDPTFHARDDAETGQTPISGMGELHLEIIRDRLEGEYNVVARTGRPQVVYRETVTGTGEADHVFERATEDETLFGKAVVRVTARPRGAGSWSVASPRRPPPSGRRRLPGSTAVRRSGAHRGARGDGLRSAGQPAGGHRSGAGGGGATARCRLGCRLAHRRVAGGDQACQAAGTALLEPIMHLDVLVPDGLSARSWAI